jgi:hypothetical protein
MLEAAITCDPKQAVKAVGSLLLAEASPDWIELDIASARGTSPDPWEWAKAAKLRWAIDSGKAAPVREFKPFIPKRVAT